jgi:hypothetical protein
MMLIGCCREACAAIARYGSSNHESAHINVPTNPNRPHCTGCCHATGAASTKRRSSDTTIDLYVAPATEPSGPNSHEVLYKPSPRSRDDAAGALGYCGSELHVLLASKRGRNTEPATIQHPNVAANDPNTVAYCCATCGATIRNTAR